MRQWSFVAQGFLNSFNIKSLISLINDLEVKTVKSLTQTYHP